MLKNDKQDEFDMRRIVKQRISPVDQSKRVKLTIHYRKLETPTLIITNNNMAITSKKQKKD